MGFLRSWFTGYIKPGKGFDPLRYKRDFYWGLWGILITWGIRDLFYLVPQYLMGNQPFEPSYLTFLSTENYYSIWIYLQPVMGVMMWLLDSVMIYFVLRLLKRKVNMDSIMNIVGLSAVIISFPLLIMDWIIYFAELRNLMIMAVVHTLFAIWGIVLQVIALKRLHGIKPWVSALILISLFPFSIVIPAIFSR